MATTIPAKSDLSVRDRLLAAANALFYEEGVHTVGIDRVIERAGVAKASLYATFGSKEELVRAYLEGRAATRRERITRRIAQHETPRERILAVFDYLSDVAAEPTFRGCAFVNASAEGPPGDKVRQVCVESRVWTRALFSRLAGDLGADDPERLGRRLALLYEGAVVGASMSPEAGLVEEARALAEELVDAQLEARRDADARKKRGTTRQPGRRAATPR